MSEYWIQTDDGRLQFDEVYVGPIDLPEDVTDCTAMFAGCVLREGCYLRHFDTSRVTVMNEMFANSTLPKGFTLGSSFSMRKVMQLSDMFEGCLLPDGKRYASSNAGVAKSINDIKDTLDIIDMLMD